VINDLQKLEEAYVGLDSSAADVKFLKKSPKFFKAKFRKSVPHFFVLAHGSCVPTRKNWTKTV